MQPALKDRKGFSETLDFWIRELEKYRFSQLSAKPSESSWSLGQVYMHLIDVTNDYFDQIQICASNHEHATEEGSATAKTMLLNNEFPDEIIEGPPSNADTPQPLSKEQLLAEMLELKNRMALLENLVAHTRFNGKTKHIGLGYFNAGEWLQFAEMHLRHHFRQKKRLDEFLKA